MYKFSISDSKDKIVSDLADYIRDRTSKGNNERPSKHELSLFISLEFLKHVTSELYPFDIKIDYEKPIETNDNISICRSDSPIYKSYRYISDFLVSISADGYKDYSIIETHGFNLKKPFSKFNVNFVRKMLCVSESINDPIYIFGNLHFNQFKKIMRDVNKKSIKNSHLYYINETSYLKAFSSYKQAIMYNEELLALLYSLGLLDTKPIVALAIKRGADPKIFKSEIMSIIDIEFIKYLTVFLSILNNEKKILRH